jgi:DNA polymerase III subunit delta
MSASVYLIHGEDEFLVSKAAQDRIDALVPEAQRVFGLETISVQEPTVDAVTQSLDQCLLALKTAGFLSDTKVVWLSGLQFPRDGRRGVPEAIATKLEQLAALIRLGLPAGQRFVISAPITITHAALTSACAEKGEVQVFGRSGKPSDERRQAGEVFDELLRDSGIRIDAEARELFRIKVGTDSRSIASELEKLAVHAGAGASITADDVSAVTSDSSQSRIWDLGNAVASKSIEKSLDVLRHLLFQKESAIGIVIHLQKRIRELLLVREALDRKWLRSGGGGYGRTSADWVQTPPTTVPAAAMAIQAELRQMAPYQLSQRVREAGLFSRGELIRCQDLLGDVHLRLQSVSFPEELALEFVIIRMLT